MESQKPMAPQPKATTAAAKVKKEEKISNVRGIRNAFIVILACAAVAVCIFLFGMGAPGNFEGNDPAGHRAYPDDPSSHRYRSVDRTLDRHQERKRQGQHHQVRRRHQG